MKQQPNSQSFARKVLCLAPALRLRREFSGGLAFHQGNGDILELDKGAFTLLELLAQKSSTEAELRAYLQKNNLIPGNDNRLAGVIKSLMERELILEEDVTRPERQPKQPGGIFPRHQLDRPEKYSWLRAPETVHWAITYRCPRDCSDCYVAHFSCSAEEMSTSDAFKVIEKLGRWGVFQLAIGGGEPFAKEGLPEIISHAAHCGLVVHLTTGLKALQPGEITPLAGNIKHLQFGFTPEDFSEKPGQAMDQTLKNSVALLKENNISPGANLFLSRRVIGNLEAIVTRIMSCGIDRIIFLRYKPPASREQWFREKPAERQLLHLHKQIILLKKKYPRLRLRTDCSLSFVQRYTPQAVARYAGFKGCVAGERILALSPGGDVYPCSQMVYPEMRAGNLLRDDPRDIWDNAKVLRIYRFFRTKKSFKNSWCAVCTFNPFCGGCRIFAHDALGGDPLCPEPLLPPLTQLGKTGRMLHVKKFLMAGGEITAWQYMERYGVSEQRAIKELNSLTGLSNRSPKFMYTNREENLIFEIRDSIGYTSGGAPFASYEQVQEMLEEEHDDYPEWILKYSMTDRKGGIYENNQY